ncbi:MAG: DUF354 domain-containing protein [Thermodesulfobacteriota bacterium]
MTKTDMRILVDIGHPAHVHFFRPAVKILQEKGHEVVITSRRKEIATDLLDGLDISHRVLSDHPGKGGLKALFSEMIRRDRALFRVVRELRPDIMTGIGGVNPAHVRLFTGVPAVIFYDTENARLSNLITYPFASLVVVPECYQAWLPPWNLRYPGYHELSYLHPNRFQPDYEKAAACGLDRERPTFLIRTVSWGASHDVSETGWSVELLRSIANYLNEKGRVVISAEGPLPADLQTFKFQGRVEEIHHLMAYSSLYVGESATMASECAVLGTPAVYAALTGRGYTDEQEKVYGLVRNVFNLDWPWIKEAMDDLLAGPKEYWQEKRRRLLADKIDVAAFVADLVSNYPASVKRFRNGNWRLGSDG